MDNDLLLVLGVVVSGIAIPSLFAAFSERRPPRIGAIMLMAGLLLLAVGASRVPGGISFDDVAGAFYRVIGQLRH